MTPLVSIIALCYNHEMFLIETLESIKQQTFQDFELVIIDNASKDNSLLLIQNWIKANEALSVHLIANPENKGVCKALNQGLHRIRGKYLQLISCDDVLMPPKIERQVKILERSKPNDCVVFSDALLIDESSEVLYGRFIQRSRPLIRQVPQGMIFHTLLSEGNFIPGMACLCKIDAIRSVGGFDESLQFEDYDLWLKLSESFSFIFDTEIWTKYRLLKTGLDSRLDYSAALFPIWMKYLEKNEKVVLPKIKRSFLRRGRMKDGQLFDSYRVFRHAGYRYRRIEWLLLKNKILFFFGL